MAVLVEAISVIVRLDAIASKYRGGWDAFVDDVPNATLCFDDEVSRVGLMTPPDVNAFPKHLECNGLRFLDNCKAIDIAVVDQQSGFTTECDWLEFGKFRFGADGMVSMCWFFDEPHISGVGMYMRGTSMQLATPVGWKFEGSLSQKFEFVPTDQVKDQLKFLRKEGGLDVFLDLNSGKEVFIGRPFKEQI